MRWMRADDDAAPHCASLPSVRLSVHSSSAARVHPPHQWQSRHADTQLCASTRSQHAAEYTRQTAAAAHSRQ
jgi:hypothetical protein